MEFSKSQKNLSLNDSLIIFLNVWLVELICGYVLGIFKHYNILIDKSYWFAGVRIFQIIVVFTLLKIMNCHFSSVGLWKQWKNNRKALINSFWWCFFLGCGVYFSGWVALKTFSYNLLSKIKVSENIDLTIILLTCILGPLFEEIVFRGILLSGLKSKFSSFSAVILSSLVFLFFHFDGISIIPLTGGIIFGISFIQSKNLLSPFLIHIAGNFALLYSNKIFVYL